MYLPMLTDARRRHTRHLVSHLSVCVLFVTMEMIFTRQVGFTLPVHAVTFLSYLSFSAHVELHIASYFGTFGL